MSKLQPILGMPALNISQTFDKVTGRRAFASSPRYRSGLSAPIAHAKYWVVA